MRWIFFSDIHSNLEALRAFFEAARDVGGDCFVCLGDVVGYAADPNACCQHLRARDIPTIGGNHDFYIARSVQPTDFNHTATQAVAWQIREVTDDNKHWLEQLPERRTLDTAVGPGLCVHGSPVKPFNYILHNWDARFAVLKLITAGETAAFVGHSHLPGFWRYRDLRAKDGEYKGLDFDLPDHKSLRRKILDKLEDFEEIHSGGASDFLPEDRFIVNVGSVGQPRDNDPRGCFVLFDDEARRIEFHRFTYPIEEAQRKIREAGLPARLAERLNSGW